MGPGIIDLAALTAGNWTEEQKSRLFRAYYETAEESGYPLPPLESLLASLDYCRLHHAVQWLGWSENWVPPAEERRDWLHEALTLAERLHL